MRFDVRWRDSALWHLLSDLSTVWWFICLVIGAFGVRVTFLEGAPLSVAMLAGAAIFAFVGLGGVGLLKLLSRYRVAHYVTIGSGPPPIGHASLEVDLRIAGAMVNLFQRYELRNFLVAANLEIVNRMSRRCDLSLMLRLRMRDGQWEALSPVSLPPGIDLSPEISLAPPLSFPLALGPANTLGAWLGAGHAAFFVDEWIWKRFGHYGLDVLNPENLIFELRDIGTGATREFPIDRQWSEWVNLNV